MAAAAREKRTRVVSCSPWATTYHANPDEVFPWINAYTWLYALEHGIIELDRYVAPYLSSASAKEPGYGVDVKATTVYRLLTRFLKLR